MKRKFLSILLTLAMALTLLPVSAMAEGDSETPAGGEPTPVEAPAATKVAKVGETEYATLAEAVKNAKTGDTIVMTADTDISETGLSIASDKDITLDLNGHEVKAANTGAGNIKVYGKLTLKDNTDTSANGEGQGKITTVTKTYIYNQADQPIIYAVNGDFVMQSGLIDTATGITNNSTDGQFGVGVQNETANASVTIEGGKIKAGWYAVSGNGNMINHDGNITVNGGILESTADYAIYNPQKGTTTINGGVIYGLSGGIAINRGTLVVNDGMITSKGIGNTGSWGDGTGGLNNAAIHANANYGDVTVSVKGGKVIAEGNAVTIDKGTAHTATVAISGGTFSSDVSAYCEKNYYTEQNEDKTYTVKSLKDVAVAQIGDTYYKSLVDAYVALPRGKDAAPSEPTTITLLKDSEGGGIGSDKTDNYMNYVIDFNGHTYTVGAPAVGSTGTVSQGIRVLKTSTAKFMNGTLKAANYNQLIQVVHTYGDVTFQDFTVDATEDAYAWAAVEPDAGTLKVLGNSSILAREGQYGLYAAFWHIDSYNGTTVDVDTTGKITGKLAYEFDEDYTGENKATENKGFVNIKNGNFDILSIQEIWSDVSDAVDKNVGGIIISGGYFTSDPSAYLAADKGLVTSDQSAFAYKVGDKATNVKTAVTAGEAAVTIPAGVSGITEAAVKDAAKAADTTKTLTDTVAASGMTNDPAVVGTKKAAEAALTAKGIPVNSGDTVTVVVQPYLEVNVKSADAGKLTLEISAKYNVVATTDDPTTIAPAKTAILKSGVPLSINKPIELTIVLPTDFATGNSKIYVQHKGYEYTATVNASGTTATFINPHGFSTFTVTSTASAIAEVDGTSYTDLQKAVDAVANNGTITLLKDTSANAVVSRAVKFTLDKNSKSFTGAITAGSGYNLSVDGNVYTFTVRSSSGSSSGSSSSSRRYDVSAPSVKHGDVTVSPKSASKGDTVTITVKPDSGYELDTLTVKDASGSKIKVKDKGDGKFTFTMPASKVTVSAEFAEIKTLDFADVSTDAYYYEAVKWAAKKGITGGTGDGTFNPNGSCTRAHIVTFLWRAAGSPEPKSTVSFADVPAGSYYAKAVAWAVENGITLGTGDGTFSPNATCTRAQSVTFLYRALGTAPTTVNGFTDVTADAFYADAVAWAVESGVTNGTSASTFSPNNGCTRAQIVTFLYRAYQGK